MLVGAFSDKIYLPRGSKWINYWTKEVFEGGQYLEVNTQFSNLQGGVLFVKEGAIIPTEEPQMYTDCKDHNDLILEVYPGNSSYTFYEDDGVSLEYKNGKRAETLFSVCKDDKTAKVLIGERKGSFEGMSDGRVYRLDVFSDKKPLSVELNGKKTEFSYEDKFVRVNGVKSGEVVVNY
jgi:alpha-glucosidase